MTDLERPLRVAVLDDYQNVARRLADWSEVERRAEITVFDDTVVDEDRLVERLGPFDVICVMRERTPLGARVLSRLPNLRLIVSTGARNASIDLQAAAAAGVEVANTGYMPTPAAEMTWALLLASARCIVEEAVSVRDGGWQNELGVGIAGKTLAILGLGNIGKEMARIGRAFGMDVIAWSPNLTPERAGDAGVEFVERDDLFRRADFLSVHLVLAPATRGLVDGALLGLMKRSARLINTSRGPIVDEAALVDALRSKRIAAAAIDVFDIEPLPPGHPYRSTPGLIATPHIGYVTEEQYRLFYGDTVRAIADWVDAPPLRERSVLATEEPE